MSKPWAPFSVNLFLQPPNSSAQPALAFLSLSVQSILRLCLQTETLAGNISFTKAEFALGEDSKG